MNNYKFRCLITNMLFVFISDEERGEGKRGAEEKDN